METRIYVGNALTNVSPEYLEFINIIKKELNSIDDVKVLEYKGTGGTPEEIARHNITQLVNCDILLAMRDFPSEGLGIEIAKCSDMDKFIILANNVLSKPSKFALGLCRIRHNNFVHLEYLNFNELIRELKEIINHYKINIYVNNWYKW